MSKLLVIMMIVGLLPSASFAAEENPIEQQKSLLERISDLQVFKLRLPYSVQRNIQNERADQAIASPDSCQAKSKHRGAEIEVSCDTHKALKKELSSVAAN